MILGDAIAEEATVGETLDSVEREVLNWLLVRPARAR
jgi:hypothetical protein